MFRRRLKRGDLNGMLVILGKVDKRSIFDNIPRIGLPLEIEERLHGKEHPID